MARVMGGDRLRGPGSTSGTYRDHGELQPLPPGGTSTTLRARGGGGGGKEDGGRAEGGAVVEPARTKGIARETHADAAAATPLTPSTPSAQPAASPSKLSARLRRMTPTQQGKVSPEQQRLQMSRAAACRPCLRL
jgi:hypothetical protein